MRCFLLFSYQQWILTSTSREQCAAYPIIASERDLFEVAEDKCEIRTIVHARRVKQQRRVDPSCLGILKAASSLVLPCWTATTRSNSKSLADVYAMLLAKSFNDESLRSIILRPNILTSVRPCTSHLDCNNALIQPLCSTELE